MLIKEIDSKINNFANGEIFSLKEIIRRRFADLINKENKDYRKEIALDKKDIFRQKERICVNPEYFLDNIHIERMLTYT